MNYGDQNRDELPPKIDHSACSGLGLGIFSETGENKTSQELPLG